MNTQAIKKFMKEHKDAIIYGTIPLGTYRILQRSWYESGHFYTTDAQLEISNVIAWMPMDYPEPYVGE